MTATTGLCLAGYVVLLVNAAWQKDLAVPLHWHLLGLITTVVVGLSVAYLVNRVSALTRFYEKPELAPKRMTF